MSEEEIKNRIEKMVKEIMDIDEDNEIIEILKDEMTKIEISQIKRYLKLAEENAKAGFKNKAKSFLEIAQTAYECASIRNEKLNPKKYVFTLDKRRMEEVYKIIKEQEEPKKEELIRHEEKLGMEEENKKE